MDLEEWALNLDIKFGNNRRPHSEPAKVARRYLIGENYVDRQGFMHQGSNERASSETGVLDVGENRIGLISLGKSLEGEEIPPEHTTVRLHGTDYDLVQVKDGDLYVPRVAYEHGYADSPLPEEDPERRLDGVRRLNGLGHLVSGHPAIG